MTKVPVAIPPDGGYGWVIMCASFVVNMLVDGMCFSFGVFYLEFLDYFSESNAKTSWIGSVLNGMYLALGPIASALCNQFGCRAVCIAGALLSAISFALSTLSPSVDVLIFLYGAMSGIGFGLMYLPSIVMVGYYFENKRAMATGVAVCGSGIGAFVFAPLSTLLLDNYGWRGAILIMSGLVLNGVLMGALFRPLSADLSPSAGDDDTNGEYDTTEATTCIQSNDRGVKQLSENLKLLSPVHANSPALDAVENKSSRSCSYLPSLISNTEGVTQCFKSQPQLLKVDTSRKQETNKRTQMELLRPMYRRDIFYSGSIKNLPEFQSHRNLKEYIEDVTRIPDENISSQNVDNQKGCFEATNACSDTIRTAMDFSLLKSLTFLIYGISCFLCMTGFFVPFVYLPDNATELGIDNDRAAFLVSIIGIANTVARVGAGWLSDRPWVDCLLINNIALIIGGVSTMLVPFCQVYELLATYSAVFGASIAVFVSLRSIVIVELLGLEKLTNAFGLVTLFQGLSSFIGVPIAGAIYDMSGTYDISFYVAGATLTVAGAICIPLRCIAKWEKRRESSIIGYD